MSEFSGTTVSRRGFLKTTAALTGAAALGTGSMTALAQTYEKGQIPSQDEHIAYCICRPNCEQICHLNIHVRNGRVVKTSRAWTPNSTTAGTDYERICQRGLTHVERIYGNGRLRTPLRRVEGTERGAGQWEKISWDEAITEIAETAQNLQAQYGRQAVCICGLTGNGGNIVGSMWGRLRDVMKATNAQPCNDIAGLLVGANFIGGNGNDCNEISDMLNSKTILCTGANITDSMVQTWHIVKEAKQKGAKLVVIDPNFTPVAAKADWWVPTRPGSDTLMYFGIINIAYARGAFDVPFLRDHTVAPFLVRDDDGQYLRNEAGDVMVIENGAAVALSEAVEPEIFAEYTTEDGVHCESALKKQMDLIAEWTPERVSEETTIPLADLNRLADLFVEGYIYHFIGLGPTNYINGAQMFAAGYLAHAVVGDMGRHGSTMGNPYAMHLDYDFYFGMPTFSSTPSFSTIDWVNVARDKKFAGGDFPVKMAIFYCANPVNTAPNSRDYIDVIYPSMDLVVVVDTAMTDTAAYADIVLPCAQHFEIWDFVNITPTMSVSCNEKAIDPPFECKSDFEIVQLLADKMGYGEYFGFADEEEVCRALLNTPTNVANHMTWDELKAAKSIRFPYAPADEPFVAANGGVFGTPTGRMEFYCEQPHSLYWRIATKPLTPEDTEKMRLVAHWAEPSENWYKNAKKSTYPFSFISVRPRFRVHSQYFAVEMLREIDPEPTLYMNPEDAAAKGIADGAYVEAFNDRGHGVGKCVYSEAIQPGIVVYPKGWAISQHKAGGWSELLNPDFSPWTCANNFMDTLCDVRVWNEGSVN